MIEEISILPLVVSIPALVLIGATILDIIRRTDLTGWRKTAWTVLVVLFPVVGTFIYLLARPFKDPAHAPRRGNERTAKLVEIITGHEDGALSDEDFAAAKRAMFLDAAGD